MRIFIFILFAYFFRSAGVTDSVLTNIRFVPVKMYFHFLRIFFTTFRFSIFFGFPILRVVTRISGVVTRHCQGYHWNFQIPLQKLKSKRKFQNIRIPSNQNFHRFIAHKKNLNFYHNHNNFQIFYRNHYILFSIPPPPPRAAGACSIPYYYMRGFMY